MVSNIKSEALFFNCSLPGPSSVQVIYLLLTRLVLTQDLAPRPPLNPVESLAPAFVSVTQDVPHPVLTIVPLDAKVTMVVNQERFPSGPISDVNMVCTSQKIP